MPKLNLHFTLILIFGINQGVVAQTDNLSAVVKFKPLKNISKVPSTFAEDVYQKLIKTLDNKNRFVAFAEGQNEPTDIAATVLAEASINSFSATRAPVVAKRPKDADSNWRPPEPQMVTTANIGGEINFTEITTGKKLEPKYFSGEYKNYQKTWQIELKEAENDRRKEGETKKNNWKELAINEVINDIVKKWDEEIANLIPIELKIKSIVEAKKNKAIRLMVDAGTNKDVSKGDTYQVIELTSYEVGGKKLIKETILSLIWVEKKKYIMETESSFKVRFGKKKIFKAINSNKNLMLKLSN